MPDFLAVFFSGYLSVFLLGFQSRLVNTGNYIGAAFCSFTIALFQAKLWQFLAKPDSSWYETLAYGLAGASAITSAIYVHKRLFGDNNGSWIELLRRKAKA